MEISDQFECLFSATVREQDGTYVIEIPNREVELGSLRPGGTYRVGIVSTPSSDAPEYPEPERGRDPGRLEPPVENGETRTVEIEDIGDQGDGITRVERGFVVIVPDTEQGERVIVEIVEVKENVAFAEVRERVSYYE